MISSTRPPCDEGVIRATIGAQPCAPASERWVLAATILGSSMAFIDGTVVNVALPVLQTELGASVTDAQWVVEAYALLLAALLLVGGVLGDRYGRKRVFGIGVALFAAASAWCGAAPDSPQLILGRALQGVGGALLVPGSLAILGASFEESRRGEAIGTWSGATGITAAIGPLLGGWLVEHASWRWVFFINLPISVIVLLLLARHVPESRDETAQGVLDWAGAALAALGLGGVTFGLIESANLGFSSPLVLGGLIGGALALGGFLVHESRTEAPMLPLALFRRRTFAVTNLVTLLLYAGLGGALFFVPFNLIQVQGYSATAAGAALLPMILLISLLSRRMGGLVSRVGPRLPLTVGPLLAAAGYVLFALPGIGGSYWTTFFPAVVVLGLGMAISVAPLTTAVMGSVEARQAGLASGVNNAVSRVAGLLAIAALSLVVLAVFQNGLTASLSRLDIPTELAQSVLEQRVRLAAITPPASLSADSAAAVRAAIDQSYVAAFRTVMLMAAVLSAAAGIMALRFLSDPAELHEESAL